MQNKWWVDLLLRLANLIQSLILIGHLYSSSVVRFGSTDKHQEDKCLNEIGPCTQNLFTIMCSIANMTMPRTHHLPWWGFPPCVGSTDFLVPLVDFQHSAKHCKPSIGVVMTNLFGSHFLYSLHATIHMSVQVHLQVTLHLVINMLKQTDIQKEICYFVYASHSALLWFFPSKCWTISWSTCASCGILAHYWAPWAAKGYCGDQPTWESISLLATDNYPHAISHASGVSHQCSSLKCAHAFQSERLQNNHTSLKLSNFFATLHQKKPLDIGRCVLNMKIVWCLTILKKCMQ